MKLGLFKPTPFRVNSSSQQLGRKIESKTIFEKEQMEMTTFGAENLNERQIK